MAQHYVPTTKASETETLFCVIYIFWTIVIAQKTESNIDQYSQSASDAALDEETNSCDLTLSIVHDSHKPPTSNMTQN